MIDDCCDSVVWRMMGKHQVKLDSAHDTWLQEVLSLWEEMRFFMIMVMMERVSHHHQQYSW